MSTGSAEAADAEPRAEPTEAAEISADERLVRQKVLEGIHEAEQQLRQAWAAEQAEGKTDRAEGKTDRAQDKTDRAQGKAAEAEAESEIEQLSLKGTLEQGVLAAELQLRCEWTVEKAEAVLDAEQAMLGQWADEKKQLEKDWNTQRDAATKQAAKERAAEKQKMQHEHDCAVEAAECAEEELRRGRQEWEEEKQQWEEEKQRQREEIESSLQRELGWAAERSALEQQVQQLEHQVQQLQGEGEAAVSDDDYVAAISFDQLSAITNGFSVVNLISSGGQCSGVFRGEWQGKAVAVKRIEQRSTGHSGGFRRELAALRAVRHENVLRVLAYNEQGDPHGAQYLVQCSGGGQW